MSANSPPQFSIGQCAALACLQEVSAPKPGNVHPCADFEDTTYLDFVTSAVAILPAMDSASSGASLGQTVLDAVSATRAAVGKNTNLGTILLLAPLAMAPRESPLKKGVAEVLSRLDAEDAQRVYQAIRLAAPGGLGTAPDADVSAAPPRDLVAAMHIAADRDLVARQYANGFAEILNVVVPYLEQALQQRLPLGDAIVHVQMRLMRKFPDSLIARKCGVDVARQSSEKAAKVLESSEAGRPDYKRALADFDAWLRADGHRRNPGTTADFLAAGLFVLLRNPMVKV